MKNPTQYFCFISHHVYGIPFLNVGYTKKSPLTLIFCRMAPKEN